MGCSPQPDPPAPPAAASTVEPALAAAPPAAGAIAVAAALVARLDSDNDGIISPTEHARYASDDLPFEDLDRDGNGTLSAAEILSAIGNSDPGYNTRWN